jgi:hypothetical protein
MLSISLTLALLAPLYAGQIPRAWDAPKTNEDGTWLTDLAHYHIHYGTQSGGTVNDPAVFHYQYTITLAANQTTFTITNLVEGVRYFFSVTALDLSYQFT